jgi:YYY domain-containing protein
LEIIYNIKLAFLFYLLIQGLSLFAVPINFHIFTNLKDRGYLLSKVAGPVLFAYLYFIFWVIGLGESKLVIGILILLVLTVLSLLSWLKYKEEIKVFFITNFKIILFYEICFLLLFVTAIFIKMGDSDIANAEKFPDFSIYNRLTIETAFPPTDPWMANFPINYYYMGHLLFASISRLGGIPTEYGYNLSVAAVFCLIAVATFTMALKISGKSYWAMISALFVSFLGNFEGFFQIIQKGFHNFSWWSSVHEVMRGMIHEFPFFSFLLGDLHAHYISLPVFILILCLALDMGSNHKILKTLYASLMLGFMSTVNPWYLPAAVFIIFLSLLKNNMTGFQFQKAFLISVAHTMAMILGGAVLFIPFLLHYNSPVTRIIVVPLENTSNIFEFLSIYVFPLVMILYWFKARFFSDTEWKKALLLLVLTLIPSILLFILRPSPVAPMLALYLTLSIYSALNADRDDYLPLMITTSILMLLGCEILCFKDRYGGELIRMNTVFKFHYIAYFFLLLSTPLIFHEAYKKISGRILKASLIILFVFGTITYSIYPVMSTAQKNFRDLMNGQILTLDGELFLELYHTDELEAINWVKKNTETNDILLEATGSPYKYFARFTTFSGRPTVLGWGNHERIWRPLPHNEILKREEEIKKIYSSRDKKEVIDLIKQYKISYILVGALERKNFEFASLEAFSYFGKPVFENHMVKIYKVN